MSAQDSEGAVTRWRFYRDHFTQCDCDLFAAKDGGYVDADDYSALLSRAQRMEAALRGLMDALDEGRAWSGDARYQQARAALEGK